MKDKELRKKICRECGTPTDFCWEYIEDVSLDADIRRMKEYVRCVNKIEEKNKKKK